MEYLNLALNGRIGSKTRQRLDGVEYLVHVFWLAEAVRVPFYPEDDPPPALVFGTPGMWTLSLATNAGILLVSGQPMRHGVNMLVAYTGDSRFPGGGRGQLIPWDFSGASQDPGREDLDQGSQRRLMYRTAADVAAG